VIADFSGDDLVLPPGIDQAPHIRDIFPGPVWWSPAIKPSEHLLVGARTVWVESGVSPAAIVVRHPNRFGCGEDLAELRDLANRHGAEGWIIVDPLLSALVELPPGLQSGTHWPQADRAPLRDAGLRSLQAAEALRRRLQEVRGLSWPVRYPAGRTLTFVTPRPANVLRDALSSAGVRIGAGGWWEGLITLTLGWWHRREQLDGVAAAVMAVLAGRDPAPVVADSYDLIPVDLPRRRLNRIMTNLRGG
jgi:hypothetical protein